jgi:hypothetical protein
MNTIRTYAAFGSLLATTLSLALVLALMPAFTISAGTIAA